MCDYANRTEDALRLIEKVAAPNLFMVLDFYHMEVMGEDRLAIEPYIRTCAIRISVIALRRMPGNIPARRIWRT